MTCATVNAQLKKFGYKVKLYRGRGYYYFMETDDVVRVIPSLNTVNLNTYTLNEVVDHVKSYYNEDDPFSYQDTYQQ